jgi:hypothetical protein
MWAGWPGFYSLQGEGVFLYFTMSRPTLAPIRLPIQCIPGVKLPGREADHSFPSSAEVKNGGVILLHPHIFSCCGD